MAAWQHLLAWLEGDRLHLGHAMAKGGRMAFKELGQAVPLGLGDPRLLERPIFVEKGTYPMLVAGSDEGSPVLLSVNPRPQHADGPEVRRFRLGGALFDTVLVRWVRRHGVPEVRAQVVWTERPRSGTDLYAKTIDPFGEDTDEAPRLLLHSEPAVLAVVLEAWAAEPEGVVDVLTGTLDGSLTLHRIPLTDQGEPVTWAIPEPVLAEGESASAWALTAEPLDELPVAVAVGSRVMVYRAGSGGEWTTIAEGESEVAHLSLHALGGHPWAVWFEASAGIRYQSLGDR
ncbi:MAG: hypothetical protein JRI25_26775, partial [Deltaproteobacteria bacterium]|nr:hypothetical protein [Deltaproteobacteria bacterium]